MPVNRNKLININTFYSLKNVIIFFLYLYFYMEIIQLFLLSFFVASFDAALQNENGANENSEIGQTVVEVSKIF